MAGPSATGNFAQAGIAAARENERLLKATLENSPNMGEIVQKAHVRQGKENIASINAEKTVSKSLINEYAATKTKKAVMDAEWDYKKTKRKAGILASAGGLLGAGIAGFAPSGRKKREVGEGTEYLSGLVDKYKADADSIRTKAEGMTTDYTPINSDDTSGGTAFSTPEDTTQTSSTPDKSATESTAPTLGSTPEIIQNEPKASKPVSNANPDRAAAFNEILDIAKTVGGTKFPEVVAAQAMHETGWLSAPDSVYKASGGTNPFGQTGDRGYGTIPRKGFKDGWTLYPDKETAVRDHIKLWHDTKNHPGNYNAFGTIREGVASVAPVYSPDADPENIRRGFTVDGYSKGVKSALTEMGYGF